MQQQDMNWEQQAEKLVRSMTLEEKVLQMRFEAPAIERLGIRAYNWWNEALHGVARAGTATIFPQSIAMAATFNQELVFRVADTISTEVRAKYNEFQRQGDGAIFKGLTCWSPNINIFRDPRWGRGHETYGEDPWLTGRMGVAFIRGLQGDDPVYLKTAACAKHLAAHSGPESMRHYFNAEVSRKDLYDTYLPAFEDCVKEANVEAVMGAYTAVNGEACCASQTLISDILRSEWGFTGHYVSDCGAIMDIHRRHCITSTPTESAALAVRSGCDLNCGEAYSYLIQAVREGLLDESHIDTCVKRLMVTRLKLGTIGQRTQWDNIPYTVNDCPQHHELSLETARQSMVLLKNDGILPLEKGTVSTIAVIGPNADSREALLANYHGTPSEQITVLEGIRQLVGDTVRVLYAQGCHLYKANVEPCAREDDRISEAVSAAQHADVTVLCIGLDATLEGEAGDAYNAQEGGDKHDLMLPESQRRLMEALAAVGKPVVVVNMTGSSVDLSFVREHFSAIVQAWYPGQMGGLAVAELLFGRYSPSGRLPITFYDSVRELPEFTDYSMDNRTYRYTRAKVQYPFGFGLSYTTFAYDEPVLSAQTVEYGQALMATVNVTNTGDFESGEAVQLYIRYDDAPPGAPRYQLKGLHRIVLPPGGSQQVVFNIRPQDMALTDDEGNRIIYPGSYTAFIGGCQPDSVSEALAGYVVKQVRFTVLSDNKEEQQ